MSRALAKSCVAATAAGAESMPTTKPSDSRSARSMVMVPGPMPISNSGRQASAVAADMPRNSLQFANGVIEGPNCGVHVSRPHAWGGVAREKVSVLCETVPPVGLPRRVSAEEWECAAWIATPALGIACSDCVVTVLLGASGGVVDLDPDEQAALQALAGSGWCRRSD